MSKQLEETENHLKITSHTKTSAEYKLNLFIYHLLSMKLVGMWSFVSFCLSYRIVRSAICAISFNRMCFHFQQSISCIDHLSSALSLHRALVCGFAIEMNGKLFLCHLIFFLVSLFSCFFLSLSSVAFCDTFIKVSNEINRFTFAVSIVVAVVSAMEVNVHYKQHPVSQYTTSHYLIR